MIRPQPASALLAGVALACALPATEVAAGTFVQDATITHDSLTRYFDYYVPDGLPGDPVPLLFVLHGGGFSNDSLQTGAPTEYTNLADQEPFVVIYPNATSASTGLSGPSGSFNWNDCRNDAGPATTTADDVGFIGALIDWAAGSFTIDLERVYATGASNGGLMSYRLALELPERIAAVAAVIGNLPVNSECPTEPAQPLGVLIMNGTADVLMPWNGGQVFGDRGLVLSALQTRDAWVSALGANPIPVHTDVPDLDTDDQSTVGIDLHCGGAQGTAVAFYTVSGGGHTQPTIAHPVSFPLLGPQNHDFESAHHIWNFLERHRLDSTAAVCAVLPALSRVPVALFAIMLALALGARMRRASPMRGRSNGPATSIRG